MEKTFQTLNELETAGLVTRYAIGGAFALSFYTKPIAPETLASASLQPSPQFRRIARAVPDGQHFDLVLSGIDGEVNRVRPRRRDFGLPSSGSCARKSVGLAGQGVENIAKGHVQPATDSRLVLVIPHDRLMPLPFGIRLDDDCESHFLARRRCSISAKTCSTGLPRPGFLRASSARRSSSAICSGVSSSSNLSRSCSKTSRCSSNGSRSICSKTWAALMAGIYPGGRAEQAGISDRACCEFGGN